MVLFKDTPHGEVKGLSPARTALRGMIDTLFPPTCLSCDEAVFEPGTLCARCWGQTPFVHGLVCDLCGTPLPGEDEGRPVHCDDCLRIARPWSKGRAALTYGDVGRRLVLALKHGDRHDIARPAGRWLARAAAPMLRPDTLLAPVPLHRWRLFQRRYNQSALLARALAQETGLPLCPDLLVRSRPTLSQDGRSREGRFLNLQGAITAHPRRAARIPGRHILLVDDVMTSGATLAAAAEACFAAGADDVGIVILARVLHDP